MRNVTETHCICRSCFTHDTAAQCPTLPKWYHLMKSGHAQQERNAHACCVVCAKLKDQTNSSNSEPTRTCSAKDVSHMAYFFKMAYDADSELLSDGTEHLCSTHFQAAKVVGMKIRAVSSSCRRKKVHQPWFDDECKAAVRALRGVAVTAEQTKQLRSLYQRKKRQHAGQQYSRFEQLCRSQPTYFWKALRRGIAQSSPVVPTADEFAQHFSSVFSGPPVRPPLPSLAPPTTEDLDELW